LEEIWECGISRGRSEDVGFHGVEEAAQWSSNGGKLVAEEF